MEVARLRQKKPRLICHLVVGCILQAAVQLLNSRPKLGYKCWHATMPPTFSFLFSSTTLAILATAIPLQN